MQTDALDFPYPRELIATEPARPSRVAFVPAKGPPAELNVEALLARFSPGDLLVTNETKVLPMRIFALDKNATEILFLRPVDSPGLNWLVLFPARDFAVGDILPLPGEVNLTLTQKGLPQTACLSQPLAREYFAKHGEMALPPYIQDMRGQRHTKGEDSRWYQSAWARVEGSIAAPTASLHFRTGDLQELKARGVEVASLTLHVGAGTFFPIKSDALADHVMHAEQVFIPAEPMARVAATKKRGGRVWALGTTVARALESQAREMLARTPSGDWQGETTLFIYPPFQFRTVDALLTNFHQPKSTLLGLVAAFVGLERVHTVYAWAIERRFRLFSYGDLSVWIKP